MLSVLINTHMLEAARDRGEALLLLLIGVRICGREAGLTGGSPLRKERRLPRHARGRLRMGEAVQ